MSTEFYIKDKQGSYLSENDNVRYRKLEGKKLYDFLQTEEGKSKKFHIEIDENGDKLGIEVEDKNAKTYETDKRHRWYLRKNEYDNDIVLLSGNTLMTNSCEEKIELLETIEDLNQNIENEVIEKIYLSDLRRALNELEDKDYEIIYRMYLAPRPLTERKMAQLHNLPVMTVHHRKIAAQKKKKKFL